VHEVPSLTIRHRPHRSRWTTTRLGGTGMNDDHARSIRRRAAYLALGHDPGDPHRTRAFANLVEKAAEGHGIALHYAGDDPDAGDQAMRHALNTVARGFAAATLEALARDEKLALCIEQKARLDELMIELDLRTVEILGNA
jgi:hypothetical protein